MKANNYKIIENRVELTNEQVLAGMDFGMIQKKIPASKTISLKEFIIAIISASVIMSGIFIYRSFSVIPNDKKEIRVNNGVIGKKKTGINSNSITTKEKVAKTEHKVVSKSININKNEISGKIHDSLSFKYYQPKRCVILLPSHCCYCIPKSLDPKFAISVDSSGVAIDRLDCETVNNFENISCIWLTLQTKENSYLKLEDGLKNFAILKGKNKEIHPFLVKVTNDAKLWSADFKGKTIKAYYNKQLDVLLFFKNTNSRVGDEIRINNFIAIIKTGNELNLK